MGSFFFNPFVRKTDAATIARQAAEEAFMTNEPYPSRGASEITDEDLADYATRFGVTDIAMFIATWRKTQAFFQQHLEEWRPLEQVAIERATQDFFANRWRGFVETEEYPGRDAADFAEATYGLRRAQTGAYLQQLWKLERSEGAPGPLPVVLCSSLSANMLEDPSVDLALEGMSDEVANAFLATHSWESAVGHEATARILSQRLGMSVPFNRATVILTPDKQLIVAQYSGPRLEEGRVYVAEEVAEMRIQFIRVRLLG